MDRLGAALEEAQHIVADKPCPVCGQVFKGSRRAWRLNHMAHCEHPPRFTSPAPFVDSCQECAGRPCMIPAHQQRRRARDQHQHAA